MVNNVAEARYVMVPALNVEKRHPRSAPPAEELQ